MQKVLRSQQESGFFPTLATETNAVITLLIGVRVMSWSKNCPNCINIKVYLPCRWDTSAWTTIETRRGLGRAFPLRERNLGLDMAARHLLKVKCRRRMFIRLKIPTKWSRVVLRVKVLVNWLDKCHETVTTAATDQEDIQSLVYFLSHSTLPPKGKRPFSTKDKTQKYGSVYSLSLLSAREHF